MRLISVGILSCLSLGVLAAQDHGSITTNPFSTPEDQKAGADSFRSQCAACHGLRGEGGSNGPSLTTGTFRHGSSDASLFQTITKGVPGTAMVAFPLSGREVWQLIAFIRSVNIGKAAEQAKGDAAKGEQIFTSNGCTRCHFVHDTGGFTGPELTDVGSRRSLAELTASVLDPDADVDPDYWSLRARTKAGQTIVGIRLNEDMDTFQIREASGRLRSLRKADLASYEIVHTSPMPSFKGKISPVELEDLVAYLASLRVQADSEDQK
jgi:cytochrome c oxidase cbb3-type subunit III